MTFVPGLLVSAIAAAIAAALHAIVPLVPLLSAALVLGITVRNIGPSRGAVEGAWAPGIRFAARSLLRAGVVLLGLKLSIVDILDFGWAPFAIIAALVVVVFAAVWAIARIARLTGDVPLLLAAGFAICGVSAVSAMAAARRSTPEDTVLPIALVTVFGTASIAALPLLITPLGLDTISFGRWAGASVHDVGQVVATAQVAGGAALAAALVVKLTRVLMLAPMVAGAALLTPADSTLTRAQRPAPVPLFIIGFLGMIALRSTGIMGPDALWVADLVQTALLAIALFAVGAGVDLRLLRRTGGRALVAGFAAWIIICGIALLAVHLITLLEAS